jgi:para-nitrobenzyl esterase
MTGSTSHDVMPPMIYQMSKSWCQAQTQPSFVWYFDKKLPGDQNGAWHSSDLWYWFGTLDKCWRPMEKKDYDLSAQMVEYLTNFCKTGNPNGTGLPVWNSMQTQKHALRFGERKTRMGDPSMAKLTWTMLTNKAVGE